MQQLRSLTEKDDNYSVLYDRFENLLLRFKVKLSDLQKDMIIKTIPAADSS